LHPSEIYRWFRNQRLRHKESHASVATEHVGNEQQQHHQQQQQHAGDEFTTLDAPSQETAEAATVLSFLNTNLSETSSSLLGGSHDHVIAPTSEKSTKTPRPKSRPRLQQQQGHPPASIHDSTGGTDSTGSQPEEQSSSTEQQTTG
jgi:hypothetical protein